MPDMGMEMMPPDDDEMLEADSIEPTHFAHLIFTNNQQDLKVLGLKRVLNSLLSMVDSEELRYLDTSKAGSESETLLGEIYVDFIQEARRHFEDHKWEVSLIGFLVACGFLDFEIADAIRAHASTMKLKPQVREQMEASFDEAAKRFEIPPIFAPHSS